MSLALYSTGLHWSRHQRRCAARLQGGPIVVLSEAEAESLQWPADIERIEYVPELNVRRIQMRSDAARDMTGDEVRWCDDALRHLCGGAT